jgi:mono/diheme cytochrome c family protein
MTTPNANPPAGPDSGPLLPYSQMDPMNDNDSVGLSVEATATTMPGRSGSDSVQALHDPLMREQAEPRDGFEPVPFWVTVIFGAFLAWGGYYLGTNSADFRRDVFDRTDLSGLTGAAVTVNLPDPDPQTVDDLKKIGAEVWNRAGCVGCHQANGQGNPGQNIPPLDASEWVVGDQFSPARLSRILLYGLNGPIQVKGRTYNGAMPNHGNRFKDFEIAAVLTYIRNNWSNKGDPDNARPAITAAVVRAAREKEGSRKTNGTQMVTAAELLKLPLDYRDLQAPVEVKK